MCVCLGRAAGLGVDVSDIIMMFFSTQVINGVSQSSIKKWLFEKAMASKRDELKR